MGRGNPFFPEDLAIMAKYYLKYNCVKQDALHALARDFPDHSKQSWRNHLNRNEHDVNAEVERIRKAPRRNNNSDIESGSEEILPSSRKSSMGKNMNSANRAQKRARSEESTRSSPIVAAKRHKPLPGKKRADFLDESEEDRGAEQDELYSDTPSPPKQATPKRRPKPTPKGGRKSAPAAMHEDAAPLGQGEPETALQPVRASSLPPPLPEDSDEEQHVDQVSILESQPMQTQAREGSQELDRIRGIKPPSSDDDDDDDDDDYEDDQDTSQEHIEASLKPNTQQQQSGPTVNESSRHPSVRNSPTKQAAAPPPALKRNSDPFSKDKARAMVQPAKENNRGSRVSWDSPSQPTSQQHRKLKKSLSSLMKNQGAKASSSRVTLDDRRNASSKPGGKEGVCEPMEAIGRRNHLLDIRAFAEKWDLDIVAADDLAYRCSDSFLMMDLYMRRQTQTGAPLTEQETEYLECGFFSLDDDLAIRRYHLHRARFDRIEKRSSLEAIASRLSFLGTHGLLR